MVEPGSSGVRLPAWAAVVMLAAVTILGGCFEPGGGRPSSGGPLEASFTFLPDQPKVGEPVVFEDRSQGPVEDRVWDMGDGHLTVEPSPSHVFDTKGVYQVTLTVRAADGTEDTAERFVGVGVHVADGPDGLRVAIDATVKGLTVAFRPLVSPADAPVTSFFWDFGDGAVSRESAPIHEYAAPGSYAVVLRVSANGTITEARDAVSVGGIAGSGGLADRSFAVIAVVDSGINPYHEEFRDAAFTEHPSTFIEGYPAEAEALSLTLDATQFTKAVTADKEVWDGVKGRALYYVPGTRIIGATSIVQDGGNRILDDNGHGTATASIAAGSTIGSCPTCLVVVVEGLGDESLRWAMEQDWIDIVSNSWNYCLVTCAVDTGAFPGAPVTPVDPARSRRAVEEGRTVLFAAGNGMTNMFVVPQTTYANANTGPDWIVTVGAADASSGSTVVGTGRPVDIVSFGYDWKGASHTSMTAVGSFSGTSSSTPLAAGVFGYVLQGARAALNDTTEGPRGGGVIARGEAPGDLGSGSVLADGSLSRAEWERAVYLTARKANGVGPVVPTTLPDSAAYFLYAGYGLVDHETAEDAMNVVLGRQDAPTKTAEDQWAAVDSAIRVAIWGSWNSGGGQLSGPDHGVGGLTLQDVDTWGELVDYYASVAAESPASA